MRRTTLLLVVAVLALAGAATAATFLLAPETDWSGRTQATAPAELDDSANERAHAPLRVLRVSHGRAPLSVDGRIVPVQWIRGPVPAAGTVAVVISDENCQPDARGVSHCVNRLKLPGGGRLVVRHNHRMNDVPCLAPGERVEVSAA